MRLKDPVAVWEILINKGLLTKEQIVAEFGLNNRTVKRLLDGEPVQPKSAKTFADALGVKLGDIATIVVDKK
jgi:DNA-binding Xre family transcriptional regulator